MAASLPDPRIHFALNELAEIVEALDPHERRDGAAGRLSSFELSDDQHHLALLEAVDKPQVALRQLVALHEEHVRAHRHR